jgi:hypothetical protein
MSAQLSDLAAGAYLHAFLHFELLRGFASQRLARMSLSILRLRCATRRTTRIPSSSVRTTSCAVLRGALPKRAGLPSAPRNAERATGGLNDDVLSHELFETITDPDGEAWWNSTGGALFGEEIGDECVFLIFTSSNVYSDPFVYKIDDTLYATQPEYSNALHGCAVH